MAIKLSRIFAFIRDEGEEGTAAVLCYTEGAHQHHHLLGGTFVSV